MDFKKITEEPSLYDHLETKTVRELLEDINQEDRKVPEAVAKVIPQIEALVTVIVERMKEGGRLFYIGAGTSGRLGVLDASEIPPTFGVSPECVIGIIAGGDTALRNAVEAAEDNPEGGWNSLLDHHITTKDVVVGLAASGTTPYVVGALRTARAMGIMTAALSCNPGAPVCKAAEMAIEPVVGPEFVTGSTRMKSGTAEKLILNMITTSTMIRMGRVRGNRMVNMQLNNEKLVDRGTRMIMDELKMDYDQANELLDRFGSVEKVLDFYYKNIQPDSSPNVEADAKNPDK